jgi:hypothetical protein
MRRQGFFRLEPTHPAGLLPASVSAAFLACRQTMTVQLDGSMMVRGHVVPGGAARHAGGAGHVVPGGMWCRGHVVPGLFGICCSRRARHRFEFAAIHPPQADGQRPARPFRKGQFSAPQWRPKASNPHRRLRCQQARLAQSEGSSLSARRPKSQT